MIFIDLFNTWILDSLLCHWCFDGVGAFDGAFAGVDVDAFVGDGAFVGVGAFVFRVIHHLI